ESQVQYTGRVAERKLFERVADDVKKVKSRPSDQELLDMYGLYKQAIFADINIDKPGMLDMKGKTKLNDQWVSELSSLYALQFANTPTRLSCQYH
uniref:ACB domain-containing protein n=1 Tax=Salmo trutta TaxID=8032 RepID=A0A674D2J5_SALTR